MDVSVIIPTRGRPRKAAQCVRALAKQTFPADRFEVLVGLDGPDPETDQAVRDAWPRGSTGSWRPRLDVITCPGPTGPNPVRNRLMEECRGRTLIALNDDVRPDADLVAVHHEQQQRAAASGRPAVIVGRCPWVRPDGDRLFDRLVRETSMVFFYDRMDTADPDHDWGFRHAWSLNLSMPAASVMDVGGWADVRDEYGHDDIELAWRLKTHSDLPVLYRPSAVAVHDHRISPREYLHREYRLGRSAWLYAQRNPGFAGDLFGRDINAPEELAYCREFVHRERGSAGRLLASFDQLAGLDADVVDGPHTAVLLGLAYEQHLPLKRWMWRSGLLAAADGLAPTEIDWP
jgi:GT2 family glycosyltransferase